MIDGVIIKNILRHSDDRGYFSEIIRNDDLDFGVIGQVSVSKIYPDVIKAFHCHERQSDLWYVISGNLQVALYDKRQTSATYKESQTVFMGVDNPRIIIIPPGVEHGYRVLGGCPAEVLYIASDVYDYTNPDETKTAFDDKEIGYEWEIKNR